MSDIKRPSAPAAVVAEPVRAVNPANSFHSGPTPVGKGVLDLRQIPVAATAAPDPAPIPEPVQPNQAAEVPAAVPLVEPASVPAAPTAQIAVPATAATIEKSDLIKKFVRPVIASPEPAAPAPQPTLPNQVATQLESMQRLIPPTPAITAPTPDHKPAFAASNGPNASVKGVMAATAAVAIMGGYIWLSNYNTLTVKAAGKKAGIEASLPGYVPSSYSLSGPIAYSPGVVSLQFKSPSVPGPLTITQTRSDWNSAALLQLYVNNKSTSYVSVENQGLTIYLYNGNQATWVNKGIQYVIEGNTHLSRDQVLKIAESL